MIPRAASPASGRRSLSAPIILSVLAIGLLATTAHAEKGQWETISDGVIAQLQKDGKKIGYPGLTAGVTVDPANGDVYMVVCDQGIWKSTDAGKTFARADKGAIGGRCETGFALNFDPNGKRLACFMIYGPSAATEDAGANWTPWKTTHMDYGAVDWDGTGKALLGLRHESGGVLCLSLDGGLTWKNLEKTEADKAVKQKRDLNMVGMFDAKSLLCSRGEGILRSTDGGETWTKVADDKLAAPLMHVYKGVGYWMSDKGMLVSKDKGATWTLAWPMKAMFGPYFGKDAQHIMVVGKDGFSESTDGGKTWKVVAPLPPTFTVNRVGPNYAWDAVHDILYGSSMGKPTYKLER